MKKVLIITLFLLIQTGVVFGQMYTEKEIDAKVDSLISIMTLQEKVGQLTLLPAV